MSPRIRTLACLSALALGMSATPAHADALSGLFDLSPAKVKAWREAPSGALYWNQLDRVEPSGRGGPAEDAPNLHPALASEAALATALGMLAYRSPRGEVLPLFSPEEIKRLQMALAAAFAVASPAQDVLFVSTGPKKERGYTRKLSAAGRLFYANGGLNVLVGEAGRDLMNEVQSAHGGQLTVGFDFGQRSIAAKGVALVPAAGSPAVSVRSDWLRVPLALQSGAAAAAAAPGVSRPPAGASPAIKAQEERFELLQRLHQKGLITDAEYEKKREDLLKNL